DCLWIAGCRHDVIADVQSPLCDECAKSPRCASDQPGLHISSPLHLSLCAEPFRRSTMVGGYPREPSAAVRGLRRLSQNCDDNKKLRIEAEKSRARVPAELTRQLEEESYRLRRKSVGVTPTTFRNAAANADGVP